MTQAVQEPSRTRELKAKRYIPWEAWGVHVSAALTLLTGIINLTSGIQPALMSRIALIEPFIPLEVRHGSRITSVLAGFGLILLAGNLWRRKRTAWVLAVALLLVSIITHLIKGLDFEEASLGAGALILLLILNNSFHASTDRPSLKQGVIVLAAALAFTLVYGAAGFYLLDRHYQVTYSLLDALRQTIVMFSSFYNPGLEPLTGFGRYFAGSIYIIGLGTISFAIIMLIRPVLVRLPATPEEKTRAETLISKYGRTALARACLFEDKSYYFGPDETVTTYAASKRGAIILGDPIGPEDKTLTAIKGFRDLCGKNDWTPAYASTLPDHLDAYRAAGYESICIGYEAIVPLKDFTLEGSQNKDLRYSVNRMEKSGYQAEVHAPPLDARLIRSLRVISDAWLTSQHGGEMGFSNGWFNDDYIRNSHVIVVHGPEKRPTAFANLVPEYQKNEISVDLMRHIEKVEYGTMDFLFVKMLLWAKEQGYESFSLGLSAVVGVGEKPEDPRLEKSLHTLAEYVSRFYNFRGLHAFKEKFHPRWEPRYLVYPGTASLPLVLSTLLRVHAGNNYLWKFIGNK
jgi:phosphatidylglycerol lysyltransferase